MAHPPDIPANEPFVAFAPSEEWRKALAAAPRQAFVPDRVWSSVDGLVDRQTAPDAWLAAIQRNDALVTQIADGKAELTDEEARKSTNEPTSSGSAPSLVFDFLRLLDPYPGDRVLEIGTGTGWTAALLSARLGAEHVTTVEVDKQIAAEATRHLAATGFTPTVIVGDGTEKHPNGLLYDRVHVTCGVVNIPYSWVQQTRPGGIIVLPWNPSTSAINMRSRLVVTGDAAVGRFHGECGFMKLRSQRRPLLPMPDNARTSHSRVDPRRIGAADTGLWIALAGLMPKVAVGSGVYNPVDETFRLSLRDTVSGAHAIAIQPHEGGHAHVSQSGSRELWEELEAAYLCWVSWGEPRVDRFGLTVHAGGQEVWLDSPDNRIEVAH